MMFYEPLPDRETLDDGNTRIEVDHGISPFGGGLCRLSPPVEVDIYEHNTHTHHFTVDPDGIICEIRELDERNDLYTFPNGAEVTMLRDRVKHECYRACHICR